MNKKIAVINTNPLTYDMLNSLFEKMIPEASVFNILDDSLLPEARKNGVTDDIISKMRMYVKCAELTGADVILNQCSSVAQAVEILQKETKIPFIKIDAPMAEKAVATGEKITIIATAESTLEPSQKLVESTAVKFGKNVTVKTVLVEGALDALSEPEGEAKHNKMILNEIEKQSADCDVIVLAQASMHRVMDKVGKTSVPVFSSPETAVLKIREMLREN
ncbi:MAG: Asp/Glu/hydantoin racemase [Firmicutes bacterium]|nr:Asp/Glu/hydantoin racemase [Bacillota bacterium]